jgi:carbamoyl-phosphate synthase small subunit
LKAILALEDGLTMTGVLAGAAGTTSGEMVFNTSMTGYQEILTDPSYAGEIIIFTFPLIGNYGVNDADSQSRRIFARGLVTSSFYCDADTYFAERTLVDMVAERKLTGITDVDTRALTKHLRDGGSKNGVITTEMTAHEALEAARSVPDLLQQELVAEVTAPAKYEVKPEGRARTKFRIAALDVGIKRGIIGELVRRGCKVYVLPATATFEEFAAVKPDGVVLSNGPGDPKQMTALAPLVRKLTENYPVMGICLGHQLLALSYGLDTYKLKFGHRGANHPVVDLQTGKVYITSHNHGYAVVGDTDGKEEPFAATANKDILITHINVNDRSIEGMKHRKLPWFSVQYHPEGCPGPKDSTYLFDDFLKIVKQG